MLLYPIFLHKVSYKNRAKTLKKQKKVPFVEQILSDRVSNRLQLCYFLPRMTIISCFFVLLQGYIP
jgi:hypothetical protein